MFPVDTFIITVASELLSSLFASLNPGTFSVCVVWEAVENHTAGVLGKAGRWAETENDVQDIINNVMSEHFK